MENKQTAVDWLEEKIFQEFKVPISNEVYEQAKQMEKEQIEKAYIDGCVGEMYELSATYTAEQYYNKTYANDTTKGLPEEDSKRRGWHY